MQWSVKEDDDKSTAASRALLPCSLSTGIKLRITFWQKWIQFSVGTFGGRRWKEFHLHLWPLRWQLKQKVSFIRLRLKSCHSVFKDKVKLSFHLRLFRELKTKQTIETSEVWPYRPMCALCFLPTGSFKHGFGRDHQGCNDCVWFLESKIISDLLLPVT